MQTFMKGAEQLGSVGAGLVTTGASVARGTATALDANDSPAKGSMDYFSKSKLFSSPEPTPEFDIEAPSRSDTGATGLFGSFGASLGMGGGSSDGGEKRADGEKRSDGGWLSKASGLGSGLVQSGSGMVGMPFGKKEDESALSLSRTTRMKYFVVLLVASMGAFSVSLTFLPILPIRPQKFALMFSIASILAMGAIAMLKGPQEFLSSRLTQTELPFTVLYFGCLFGTLYGALTSSYILSVLFSAGQFSALMWYFCGAVPGGRGQVIFLNMCMTVTKGMMYPITRAFK